MCNRFTTLGRRSGPSGFTHLLLSLYVRAAAELTTSSGVISSRRWMVLAALAMTAAIGGHADASRSAPQQAEATSPAILYDGAAIVKTAVKQGPPDLLTPHAIFERKAAPGDTHRYEALLNEADFFEIRVSQAETAAAITVRDPEDRVLHSILLPDIDPQPQRLLFVAPTSGRYTIDLQFDRPPRAIREGVIYQLDKADQSGPFNYTIHVLALRPATPEDRGRAGWFNVLERAAALLHRESMDGLRASFPLLREAAAGWRSTGDVSLEASTLEALARVTSLFSQFRGEAGSARERLTELYSLM